MNRRDALSTLGLITLSPASRACEKACMCATECEKAAA